VGRGKSGKKKRKASKTAASKQCVLLNPPRKSRRVVRGNTHKKRAGETQYVSALQCRARSNENKTPTPDGARGPGKVFIHILKTVYKKKGLRKNKRTEKPPQGQKMLKTRLATETPQPETKETDQIKNRTKGNPS